ncbi:MAG: tetratricopeptide repeat protein [Burkholderiales bacterium]|nr:tetratricopeptide repeat protein [Burkholderiales bacterium]
MKHAAHRAEAHRRAGLSAMRAQAWQQAAAEFERGTRLAPADALLWMNLARARLGLRQLDPAIAAAREAVATDPALPLARRLLADALLQSHRPAEAAEVFDALPPGSPRDFDWHNAHGNALLLAGRHADAIQAFFQALALKIDAPLVHYRLGLSFMHLGLRHEGVQCYRTAIALDDPTVRALALSLLVHEQRQTCDWATLEADTAALLQAMDGADLALGQLLSPFALLAVDATPAQQRRMGALRSRGLTEHVRPLPPPGPRRPGPLRVGYLSSDFHQHATAALLAEVLERRNRQRFEVTLYSHSQNDGTELEQRVRGACEHFVDVSLLGHKAIAQRIRDDGIDLLVDLKGHTRGSRFELLAWRPAPVQLAWLGYPASTGADFIDYMVGDPVVTPLEHAANYSEQIAQLPHSYQPNDRRRALPPAPSRASLGLPVDAAVLCCFNQTYKMSPHMLDLWARILHGSPRAVLWMLAWDPHARSVLTCELGQRGVPSERVFWAPKLGLAEHIARLRAADLFLDTWPCNAHTTASEALWAGVPVLTVPGPTFASRVAASLVSACELPDLACASEDAYVERAIALSEAPAELAALKAHLEARRMSLPLFDTDRFVHDWEALLLRMAERAQAGLPPAPLPALNTSAP